MKAVLFDQHGGPQVLEYTDFPTPEPGPGEVLVRLQAAALNQVDVWVRKGWPGLKLAYPHISGADGAGEVAAVGPADTSLPPHIWGDEKAGREWAVGDRVVINSNLGCGKCDFCLAGKDNLCRRWHLLGETKRGTYAQYVVVPARQLYPIPEGFDLYAAAAAALVYHTAWHSLVTQGKLQPGESVLVVGASGGVNTACMQIAKLIGATVYAVGSNAEKLGVAEAMGADHLIDRSKEENWSKSLYLLTDKRGVNVVVDNVGTTFPLSFRAARKGGRILTVGNTGGPKFEIDNRYIFGKHLTIIGSTMGTISDFAAVMDLIFEEKLKVALDRTYPLAEAPAAQERLESGHQMGKITLAIQD
ncbi:MAG: zinc-binding dehydrogenase [Anaerolineales bacterium]|jgi:NADPH:quinone reductase-like Zn-dependent oxidoreductase